MKKKLINIPDELWNDIKEMADDECMPVNKVIILLLNKSLNKESK